MILEVQAIIEKGASKEKIGLRGPMAPGALFAVYDSEIGIPEYIPPEYVDTPGLLDASTLTVGKERKINASTGRV